jgi:hypothetical protein
LNFVSAACARSRSVGNVRPVAPVAAAGGPMRFLDDHRIGESFCAPCCTRWCHAQ